ncbi:MAG: hypothetical protein GY841_00715 [FCB group bacterium]|nr:hypothetical protein [FCB group bacterium]
MEEQRLDELIDKLDKLADAIFALVGGLIEAERAEGQDQDTEPETYLDGSPKR